MTAHPKILRPTTGELHFFGYGNIFQPHVTYHRADAAGNLTVNRPLEVPALTMMHDFAMSSGHVVFMDLPIVFNLDIAINGKGDMPYRWDDGLQGEVRVLRRDDPLGRVRWFDIEPATCSMSRTPTETNPDGFADGPNRLVVQGCRYPELWRNDGGFRGGAALWEWVIDLDSGTVTERQLDDRAVEFPASTTAWPGYPRGYAVSVGGARLMRYDLTTGAAAEHLFGSPDAPGGPGEAVFVPSSSGAADESGLVRGLRL